MYNIDIEVFYKRIKKSIDVVAAYTSNKHYIHIIKACRLKPLETFDKSFTYTPQLYKIWVDEYGHSLDMITGNITLNNPAIPNKAKQTTDLFFGISFNKHIEKSIRGLFVGNNFPEMIAFYGRDEYIRGVDIGGSGMSRISPLEFGLNNIYKLITHNGVKQVELEADDRYKRSMIVKIDDNLRIEELFDGE